MSGRRPARVAVTLVCAHVRRVRAAAITPGRDLFCPQCRVFQPVKGYAAQDALDRELNDLAVTLAPVIALGGLGRLSAAAHLAEKVNPGRVRYVATIADLDGANCEIGADYDSVLIGPYRFKRDTMPEVWAAIGEAAWLAGVHEAEMAQGDQEG